MRPGMLRLQALLLAAWGGSLLTLGALVAPRLFALTSRAQAGQLVGALLTQEAKLSVGLGLVVLLIERAMQQRAVHKLRSVMSVDVLMLLVIIFVTLMSEYALRPLMPAARAGQGAWSFAALHALALSLFVLKALLVLTLAWRKA